MKDTFEGLSLAAIRKKTMYQRNKLGYLFVTMLGGISVGFGII